MEVFKNGITLKFTEEETDALITVLDLVDMLDTLSNELWEEGYNTNIDIFENDINIKALRKIKDEIVDNNYCIRIKERKNI